MDFVRNLFKGDKYIWGIFFVLCIISGIEMYSASSTLAYRASEHYNPAFSHLTHLIFGTIGVIIIHNMPPHYFRAFGYLLYPVTLLLLIAVMFTPQVNGASRHLFGFQPSELAKFATIAVTCAFLAKGQLVNGITKESFYSVLIASAVPCLLILKENFSTAFLLGLVIFSLMFIARVQLKRMLAICGIIVVLGTLFLSILSFVPANKLPGRMTTWKSRLEQTGEPVVKQKVDDKNRQVQYGHMAVANGGLTGKFIGNSQIRDFLPQAYSDFIYSIIIEEMGLVIGGIGVMFIYLMLLVRAGIIFRRCKSFFPGLLLLGVTMLIVYQALMSMAVGVGMFVTGQPLPLISRGGTSIFMTCAYFGIILSISRSAGVDEEDLNEELTTHKKELTGNEYEGIKSGTTQPEAKSAQENEPEYNKELYPY